MVVLLLKWLKAFAVLSNFKVSNFPEGINHVNKVTKPTIKMSMVCGVGNFKFFKVVVFSTVIKITKKAPTIVDAFIIFELHKSNTLSVITNYWILRLF